MAPKQLGAAFEQCKQSPLGRHSFVMYEMDRRLAKNARIAPYAGEKRTRAQVSERYGSDTGQYVLCRSDEECFDARKSNASLARFANDARGTQHTNNAKFTPGVPSGTPLLRATRPIPAGREIFTSYGREYWS